MNNMGPLIGQERRSADSFGRFYAVVDSQTLKELYVGRSEEEAARRSVPGTAFGFGGD
jgi:hypothetical protein